MSNKKILILVSSAILLGATIYWYTRKRKFTPTEESAKEEIEIIIKN